MAAYALLFTGALLNSLPFIWMFGTAFKTLPESTANGLQIFPSEWQWHNIPDALSAAPFGRYFFNSFLVAIAVALAVMFTALCAGYAFTVLKFRGSQLCFALVLATMMVPFEVTLIPNFVLVSQLGWYNTYAALILPWAANAFSIFLLRQAFLGVPQDYFDAARIDGCGHLRFLFRMAFPLVRPMLITAGLFAFLGSYNSLLWPLVITSEEEMRVVQVGLTVFAGDTGLALNLLMCASLLVMLPTVALYFAAQRYFLEGAFSGGLKG